MIINRERFMSWPLGLNMIRKRSLQNFFGDVIAYTLSSAVCLVAMRSR